MRIVYIGEDKKNSNSLLRAQAMERLGHEIIVCNPFSAAASSLTSRWKGAFHYRTGYIFLQSLINKWVRSLIKNEPRPDLVWVNSGELLGPQSIKILKQWNVPVVLYNNDDPTGGRDGRRFLSLLRALRMYDLCVVLRTFNVDEYKQRGAKKLIRQFMSYDEQMHKPFADITQIDEKFRSEVAFIGTWMPGENRDEFLLKLVTLGVPVTIWGDHWQKSPLWDKLQFYYKGKALGGRDYVAGIQGAKICIGMLSKGNRDLHTRRSVEVPYVGGLLCAERTPEHVEMYKEGEEALFWDDAEECAKICKELLADDNKREGIRLAGMRRVRKLGVGNEDIVRQAISALDLD
ncbi:MAG: glycosyltransferase [Chitinophagaceae bacterium]